MESSHSIKSREQLEDSVQAVTCLCLEIAEGPVWKSFENGGLVRWDRFKK